MNTPTPQSDPDDLEWLRERGKAMGDRMVRTQKRLVPAKP